MCDLHVIYAEFTSCMHPIALFIYLLCLCFIFLKLAPRVNYRHAPHAGTACPCRRLQSKVTGLHGSHMAKTFFRPLSQCRRDGVLQPCQFISTGLTMTCLQYMTFSDTKGWIDLTVSVKGMDGWEGRLRHRGLEALRKNTFSN